MLLPRVLVAQGFLHLVVSGPPTAAGVLSTEGECTVVYKSGGDGVARSGLNVDITKEVLGSHGCVTEPVGIRLHGFGCCSSDWVKSSVVWSRRTENHTVGRDWKHIFLEVGSGGGSTIFYAMFSVVVGCFVP